MYMVHLACNFGLQLTTQLNNQLHGSLVVLQVNSVWCEKGKRTGSAVAWRPLGTATAPAFFLHLVPTPLLHNWVT